MALDAFPGVFACVASAGESRTCCKCTALQPQGPDGKWNKFTGRYAWDASWLCSNEYGQYGGTGERKPEDMVFPYAPNLDHSQVPLRPASFPGVYLL